MQLKIWGCRGSVPSPGPTTVVCGGNTSCVEISLDDGTVLVLDAGTGIRDLGDELVERGVRRIHLLLTHLHLDHVEGLRFFAPLFDPKVTLDVWGPASTVGSLEDSIARTFSRVQAAHSRSTPRSEVARDQPGARPSSGTSAAILSHVRTRPGPRRMAPSRAGAPRSRSHSSADARGG